MKGHAQILAIRQKGYRPSTVFVDYGLQAPKDRWGWDDPEKAIGAGMLPTVYVEAGEECDLRFMLNLNVVVTPYKTAGLFEFLEACAEKAQRVTCLLDGDVMVYEQGRMALA